jgi:hypothetical protein
VRRGSSRRTSCSLAKLIRGATKAKSQNFGLLQSRLTRRGRQNFGLLGRLTLSGLLHWVSQRQGVMTNSTCLREDVLKCVLRARRNRKRAASAPKFKAPQKRRLRLAMMSDILPAYKKTLVMPKPSMAVAGRLMKQCKMIQQRCTLYQSCIVINECCVLPGSRINTTLSMAVSQPQPPHR